MDEDAIFGEEPAEAGKPADPAQAPLRDRSASTAVAADGPTACTPGTPGTLQRLGRISRTRVFAVIGIAVLVVGGSLLGAFALSSSGASHPSGNLRTVLAASHGAAAVSGATITVTGNGQVEGTPDTATFQAGVDTTASTAVAALEKNNAQVTSLEQSLELNGVEAKDIQTSWLNLSANTNSNGQVTGFSADDELTVTMKDLSNLGVALDSAVHATGNGVTLGGISFSISNQSALLAAARAQAMLEADTEGSQLAAGAGLALGPIVKVTDQENAGQQVFYSPVGFAAASASASAVPVQAGQQQLSVQVTVVYQLVSSS